MGKMNEAPFAQRYTQQLRIDPFSDQLSVKENLTLQILSELRRIRHALERMAPPSDEDRKSLKQEAWQFEKALEELRSLDKEPDPNKLIWPY